jgi:hypothetical protein
MRYIIGFVVVLVATGCAPRPDTTRPAETTGGWSLSSSDSFGESFAQRATVEDSAVTNAGSQAE